LKRFATRLAVAAALAAPAVAFGQEAADEQRTQTLEAPVEAEVQKPEPSGPNTGRISVSAGVDFTTAYFFRGYNQEDQGFIMQPYANLYAKLLAEEDLTLNAYVGTWNSLHSEHTGANPGGGPDAWYESDFLAGVDVISGAFTLGLVYTAYTYPNGAFETVQEVGAKLTWDDSQVMEDRIGFALKPYVAVYAETGDGNGSEDWYGEVGINPGVYTFNEDGRYPVALTVPISVGVSLKDYYFDEDGDEDFFGFLSVGVTGSVPLPFIPSDFGSWNLVGNVTYLYLGSEGLQAINHDEDYEIIGKLGIAFAY
jgi:hypothetical protein